MPLPFTSRTGIRFSPPPNKKPLHGNVQRLFGFFIMDENDLHWLSGLLEGEGSFLKGPPSAPHQPRVSIAMTDEDIIVRVALLLGVKHHPSGQARCAAKGWTPAFNACLKGSRAVTLMEQLRPLMGKRRQAQIDAALACYRIVPHPTTRLNQETAAAIKRRIREGGTSVKILAESYNVNESTIYQIKWGKTWTWVE